MNLCDFDCNPAALWGSEMAESPIMAANFSKYLERFTVPKTRRKKNDVRVLSFISSSTHIPLVCWKGMEASR